MKSPAAGAIPVLLLLAACASREAATAFSETPDPAGARRIEGDWILAMKTVDREVDGKLHFAYDGTFVSGSFTEVGRDARPISDVRVSRNRVAWKIDGGRDVEEFSGSLASDGSLSGQMTIARRPASPGDGKEPAPEGEHPGHGAGGGRGRRGASGGGHGGDPRTAAEWSAVPAPRPGADSK